MGGLRDGALGPWIRVGGQCLAPARSNARVVDVGGALGLLGYAALAYYSRGHLGEPTLGAFFMLIGWLAAPWIAVFAILGRTSASVPVARLIYPSLWAWTASLALLLSYITGLNLGVFDLEPFAHPVWLRPLEFGLILAAVGVDIWLRVRRSGPAHEGPSFLKLRHPDSGRNPLPKSLESASATNTGDGFAPRPA